MPFIKNESFKHSSAKELLCGWLEKKNSGRWCGDGVHLEYPLIPAMRCENFRDLVCYGYSFGYGRYQYYNDNTSDFNPTYEQCIANNDIPVAVLDIAVVYKGFLQEGFEVYHTHRVDDTKKRKIMDLTKGLKFKLYEISAETILCQTKIPEDIYALCSIVIS